VALNDGITIDLDLNLDQFGIVVGIEVDGSFAPGRAFPGR
jgi:hypothetical protein